MDIALESFNYDVVNEVSTSGIMSKIKTVVGKIVNAIINLWTKISDFVKKIMAKRKAAKANKDKPGEVKTIHIPSAEERAAAEAADDFNKSLDFVKRTGHATFIKRAYMDDIVEHAKKNFNSVMIDNVALPLYGKEHIGNIVNELRNYTSCSSAFFLFDDFSYIDDAEDGFTKIIERLDSELAKRVSPILPNTDDPVNDIKELVKTEKVSVAECMKYEKFQTWFEYAKKDLGSVARSGADAVHLYGGDTLGFAVIYESDGKFQSSTIKENADTFIQLMSHKITSLSPFSVSQFDKIVAHMQDIVSAVTVLASAHVRMYTVQNNFITTMENLLDSAYDDMLNNDTKFQKKLVDEYKNETGVFSYLKHESYDFCSIR